jgi:hypothetical protein
LQKQSREVEKQFTDGEELIARSKPGANDVSDDISGRVQEKAVRAALEEMDCDVFGFMDLAPMEVNTHHKFVAESVPAILPKNIPQVELRVLTSTTFATLAEMLKPFAWIEECVLM